MRRTSASLLALCCAAPTLVVLASSPASAAAFTPGNVVVEQVGVTGSTTALSSAATAVVLDEFAPAGGAVVQSIALPTTSSTGVNAVTTSGTAASEGQITNSADGRFIEVAGYNAAVGTTGIASTTSANDPRDIAQVSAAGAITSTTTTAAFSANNIRTATSPDGSTILSGGANSGIQTQALGTSASSTASAGTENLRAIHIFGGTTFASSGSGAFVGVDALTGTTLAPVPGVSGTNPYSFALLKTGTGPTYGTTGLDTLYVADSTTGVTKYVWSGTAFTASGTVAASGVTGLAARMESGVPVVYYATPTTLSRLPDAAAALAGPATTVATASTNTAFRGVAFAPPTPASVALPTVPVAGASLPEAPYAVLLPLMGLTAVGVIAMRRSAKRA